MQRPVFAPVLAALVLLLLGVNLAIQLGLQGSRFTERLNDRHPALAAAAPEPGRIDRPRLARRVVLVIIDGLRTRESIGLPYLDGLRRRGIEANASSHYPTFSRPNYVSIVTGVPPQWSGVRSNDYDHPVALDSLMDRARAGGLRAGFISNYSPALPRFFTRGATADESSAPDAPEFVADFDDMHYVQWPGGFVNASRLLLAQGYELVIMHLGEVDAAGHEEGADSPEYRAAAREVDRRLARALDAIDLSRDAIIVVADHGHTDHGGHGGLEDEVVEVPLILAGSGVRPSAAIVGAQLIDVAPTAATLLGLRPPGHGLGRTLTSALEIDEATRQALRRDDDFRVQRNLTLTSAARDRASATISVRRVWRIPLVLGLLVVAIVGLFLARRVGAIRLDWRVLAIAVPAFPATYYVAIGLLEQQYSPSAAPAIGDITGMLVRWGLVSTAAQIVFSWIALRGRVVLRDRLAAANGLTACGLIAACVPAGLAWAYFTGPFVDLPGPALMVLVPATLVAVAFYAVASTATLALEIVVFFSRAVDPRVRLRRLEAAAARERSRLQSED